MEEIDSFEPEDEPTYRLIIVDRGQESLRIDKYLVNRLEKVSRNRIQTAVEFGGIMVNDHVVRVNYKVRPLDVIKVTLPPEHSQIPVIPEDIPLDIVYEDEYLLVVNKPAGMVVHPGVGNRSGTLVNALMYHYQNTLPLMPGNEPDRPGLVHRIDKETSGLLIIAKEESTMTDLAKQFFEHTIDRSYVSLVWGNFEESQGTIEAHIGRHPTDMLQMYVYPNGETGKWAKTHYRVLEDLYYVSLVECKLETGRTHQIRVHMNYLGHPVFNDRRYGGNRVVKGTIHAKYRQFVNNCFEVCRRHALHAQSLGFMHPMKKERMLFTVEPPADMINVLIKWREYVSYKKDLLVQQDED